MILTCAVDAEEDRDVALIDIPNAFIQPRVENEEDMVTIRVRGILVDILLGISPKVYGPYVIIDKKGNQSLILTCMNVIYGTMVASLLYYKKFCKSLIAYGFKLNPYDPCVANRMVNWRQQTVFYHVDDCKISHVDTKANDDLIKIIKEEYKRIFEDGSGKMTLNQGKVHKYLGMTLDYTTKGLCKVTMFEYIEEVIKTFDKMDHSDLYLS